MNKSDRTREFIIEATAGLFNRKGFAGTSLSDISEATGLSKGSIYGNFANKDEVALAVFEFNLKQVNAVIGLEMEKRETYKEKLLVYADVYADFFRKPFPQGGCPVLNTATEADDTHPALKEKAANAVQQWKSGIAKLVRKGKEAKEFRKEIDEEEIAVTMIALIEGGIMISRVTGKKNYLGIVANTVRKMINGLE